MVGPPVPDPHRRRRQRLQALLLVVWFAVSFGALFFARDLESSVDGWPFNYWWAAQGGVLAFVAIVGVYAAVIRRFEPEDDPDWPEQENE